MTAASERRKTGNLPAEVTSFVGRRQEITEARRLLSAARLLTLTGPGGVGKTRLALQVAEAARRSYRDGVRLVELADLSDASLLGHTTAESLGLHVESSRNPVDIVTDHLASRETLLVVDNCEHLVDQCAQFLAGLLRHCPRLTVLATSRQSIGVYGEITLLVPPLPVPDPGHDLSTAALSGYDSVRLFVERARAVLPGFELDGSDPAVVARLCRDLDGIPLAIELAAAWLRALSLSQLEERLSERYRLLANGPRTAPTRQRTLRALIDWSHDLCSRPEQLLWARASVFAGGFDLPAIEYVAGDGTGLDGTGLDGTGVDGAEGDGVRAEGERSDGGASGGRLPGDGAPVEAVPVEAVPDLVRALVDKSVLIREEHHGAVRYRMLEAIRAYGHEKLAAGGNEKAVRRRHRDRYAELVARFEAEWIGAEQTSWLDRLEHEHANLRAALAFCLAEPGEAVVALRMATGIDEYWSIRGINTEARYWLDQALAASPEPSRERVSALCLNAWYALLQGDARAARPMLAEADRLTASVGGGGRAAFVAHIQGMAALFSGDAEQAVVLLTEALAEFRAGRPRGELFALSMLGFALGLKGEREKGLAHIEECLTLAAERGEKYWRSWGLWVLAFLEVDHDLERAEAAVKEALEVHGRMQSRLGTAFVIETLAWIAERQQHHVRAATLFGAAAAVWHELGATPDGYAPMAAAHRKHRTAAQAALGDERYQDVFQHGYRMAARQAVDYALESRRGQEGKDGQDGQEGRESHPESAGSAGSTRSRQLRPDRVALLTPRERQVAALLAEGLSNKEIAARLVVSTRTAETHVDHILSKLGFNSRAQVAAWFSAAD